MVAKLSKLEAEALTVGGVIRCHVVGGLELHAKPTGKFWFFYYRQNGKRRRPKIGEFPTLSLEAARDVARDMVKAVAGGKDPSADRAAARDAPTVDVLVTLYLEHLDLRLRRKEIKAAYEDAERRYCRNYVGPLLGKLDVRAVTREDVNKALDRCAAGRVAWKTVKGSRPAKGGRAAAGRLRACLSNLFTFSEDQDVKLRDANTNPVEGSTTYKQFKRRNRLQGSQFERAHAALELLALERPEDVLAIRTILLCGSRVSEITDAPRLAFVVHYSTPGKIAGGTLNLDAHKTDRTGEPRVIRLPSQIVEELNALPIRTQRLFPPHVTRYTVSDVWREARELADCQDVQLRDMRRTFASAAKSAGASLEQAGELMGHNSPQTTDLYSFLFDDKAAELAQATADQIERQMKGPKT